MGIVAGADICTNSLECTFFREILRYLGSVIFGSPSILFPARLSLASASWSSKASPASWPALASPSVSSLLLAFDKFLILSSVLSARMTLLLTSLSFTNITVKSKNPTNMNNFKQRPVLNRIIYETKFFSLCLLIRLLHLLDKTAPVSCVSKSEINIYVKLHRAHGIHWHRDTLHWRYTHSENILSKILALQIKRLLFLFLAFQNLKYDVCLFSFPLL